MTDRSHLLISPEELAARLGDPDLRIVDATWYLATMGRDAAAEFAAERIPGAVHFEIDGICDKTSPLPHMLADADAFAAAVGALGLSADAAIVVYDRLGLFSAPRVWWNLRVYGATNVRILDGGLGRWKPEGRPLETGAPRAPVHATFAAKIDADRIADFAAVAGLLASGAATVVDARPAERFRGETAEPRAGLPSGHMRGAASVPFGRVVVDGRLADDAAVRAAFAEVDLARPIVTSCGSGVSAAILWLALESIGVPPTQLALYDGSWTEWASRGQVVTGDA